MQEREKQLAKLRELNRAIVYPDLVIFHPESQQVCIAGKLVELSEQEYKALELLYQKKNQTVSFAELKTALWPDGRGANNRNLAQRIHSLRTKISDVLNIQNLQLITTINGESYELSLPSSLELK